MTARRTGAPPGKAASPATRNYSARRIGARSPARGSVRNPEPSAGDTDDSKSGVVHLDTISTCSIDIVEDTDTDPEHGYDEEGAEAFHPRERLSADQAS